ncbi:MAG: glycosyltransferase [Phycisphaerales bacterium]|nr:glycosyltransferase [Phycisphaerales bacterium]
MTEHSNEHTIAPPSPSASDALARVGVVAIGRNEGERLRRCLGSLPRGVGGVVYVDSGSTDGSVELARSLGVVVVELDMSVPFTASRARNCGVEALRRSNTGIEHVHLLDGDCEMDPGWMESAVEEMGSADDIAVVCGQRRERSPEETVYNRICDIEWHGEPGDIAACGGDALVRLAAFDAVGGYESSLIAGEEPEMCFRMRREGWRIRRLAGTMTWHDAAMTTAGQWWKRCVRAGHAAAEGAWMHGRSAERYNVRRCVQILVWSAVIPAIVIVAGAVWFPWGFAAALVYPSQWARLILRELRRRPARDACVYASHLALAKFPQMHGVLTFIARRALGRQSTLIEYKRGGAPADGAPG